MAAAAWYQLDGWDVAGAIAEYGVKVSAAIAQNLRGLAYAVAQQAQSAA